MISGKLSKISLTTTTARFKSENFSGISQTKGHRIIPIQMTVQPLEIFLSSLVNRNLGSFEPILLMSCNFESRASSLLELAFSTHLEALIINPSHHLIHQQLHPKGPVLKTMDELLHVRFWECVRGFHIEGGIPQTYRVADSTNLLLPTYSVVE